MNTIRRFRRRMGALPVGVLVLLLGLVPAVGCKKDKKRSKRDKDEISEEVCERVLVRMMQIKTSSELRDGSRSDRQALLTQMGLNGDVRDCQRRATPEQVKCVLSATDLDEMSACDI